MPVSRREQRRPRAKEVLANIALVIASIAVTVAGLELSYRLWRGPEWLVKWPNLIVEHRQHIIDDVDREVMVDPDLGFVTRPNYLAPGVNQDSRGFRSVPDQRFEIAARPLLLASGDSFTYGEEVDDAGTWPA